MRLPTPRATPILLTALLALCVAAPARAQTLGQLTATPEEAAKLYLRSVRSIRWSATAQFLADTTLADFRLIVTLFSEADTTGAVRRQLVQTDSAGLAEMAPAEVFSRSIGGVIDGMPGLMHALYDRDDEVIGHVAEGADTAHVVYRTTARISGAEPEVKVMQLVHTFEGWRVLWSDELEVIEAALRGVGR